MGNCVGNVPVDGGTFRDSILINPTIYGGTATDINLKSPIITGGITLDELTAKTLVAQICSEIKECIGDSEFEADRITSIVWDDDKENLKISAILTDGQPNDFTIPFTQFVKADLADGIPPATTESDAIPNVFIGNPNVMLCGPVKWQRNADGTVTPKYYPAA